MSNLTNSCLHAKSTERLFQPFKFWINCHRCYKNVAYIELLIKHNLLQYCRIISMDSVEPINFQRGSEVIGYNSTRRVSSHTTGIHGVCFGWAVNRHIAFGILPFGMQSFGIMSFGIQSFGILPFGIVPFCHQLFEHIINLLSSFLSDPV